MDYVTDDFSSTLRRSLDNAELPAEMDTEHNAGDDMPRVKRFKVRNSFNSISHLSH